MNTLEAGAIFPDFTLPAARAAETTTLCRADCAGRPHIIFFYPKDATCGCTVEVCGFRDHHAEFETLGVGVIGVSRDTMGAHRRFIENQKLPFALMSDTGRELIAACGLLKPKTMYGKPVVGTHRATFALDGAGLIRHIWRDVQPIGHADAVLSWCRAAQQ